MELTGVRTNFCALVGEGYTVCEIGTEAEGVGREETLGKAELEAGSQNSSASFWASSIWSMMALISSFVSCEGGNVLGVEDLL